MAKSLSSIEKTKLPGGYKTKPNGHGLQPADNRKFTCCCCGSSHSKRETLFPKSQSPSFKGNDYFLPICMKCFRHSLEEYVGILGDQDEAIKRMCLHWDIYVDETLIESLKGADWMRMKEYITSPTLIQGNRGKTYDDYLFEKSLKNTTLVEEVQERGKPAKLKSKNIKNWGAGLDDEEYEFLDNQYDDWRSKCVVDTKGRETLVREICMLTLQQNKALLIGKVDLYNKLTETKQKTIDRASLSPKQEEANDKAMEIPIGMMIDRFENDRPVPEANEEWKDVDGIMKLILVYFIGHLCKMIGIKNRYAAMYEEEMDKYRVTVPELSEADTEDIFDYLLDNGFLPENGEKNEN